MQQDVVRQMGALQPVHLWRPERERESDDIEVCCAEDQSTVVGITATQIRGRLPFLSLVV
jgi:hypothetical protein